MLKLSDLIHPLGRGGCLVRLRGGNSGMLFVVVEIVEGFISVVS